MKPLSFAYTFRSSMYHQLDAVDIQDSDLENIVDELSDGGLLCHSSINGWNSDDGVCCVLRPCFVQMKKAMLRTTLLRVSEKRMMSEC